ncbi:hypothetical protein PENSTE_c025G07948 [Penicillium steckii]|uniref:(2E,6E)-farnesyl diphosphate synthase n=1 Tax=Penicillium steckii TaxID=303698 RepID=A0A1V6SRD9_9EURO|nr:hypothetical protein PENSTE_c025G07948 [Penicillium steckii]
MAFFSWFISHIPFLGTSRIDGSSMDNHSNRNESSLVNLKCSVAPTFAPRMVYQEAKPLNCISSDQIASQCERIVRAPLDYLLSIPGKDIRSKIINAFNEWLLLPEKELSIVKDIINLLHTASLLIDDIQDGSHLRRGHPVAHDIFGVAQTINSANYAYYLQQSRLREIGDPQAFVIFTKALLDLHMGQGMDLYWRDAVVCPTEEEYTRMVAYKTGGLFHLALNLMQIQSDQKRDFSELVELLGVIFQIRDDYLNLHSVIYAEKKGLMEDITEGKFSFPIIHSIHCNPNDSELFEILKLRTDDEAVNMRAFEILESTGSFQYTRTKLKLLQTQARGVVKSLEAFLGPNKGIYKILDLLEI